VQLFIALILIFFMSLFMVMSLPLDADDTDGRKLRS
jgi:hypothetical protein